MVWLLYFFVTAPQDQIDRRRRHGTSHHFATTVEDDKTWHNSLHNYFMQNENPNWSFRDPISRSSTRCPSVTVAAAGGCEIARRDEKSVRAARGAHSMIPPICPCRPPTSPVHGMPSIWMGRFVTSEHLTPFGAFR